MKKSNFTIDIKLENTTLLYNTLTSELIQLEEEEIDKFEHIETFIEDTEFIKVLYDKKFIIDNEIDEYNQFIEYYNQIRNSKEYVRFVIAPTTDCNFSCTYCFEKDKKISTMNDYICNCTVNFIKEKSKDANQFDIIWYGGEPLCAYEEIKKINELLQNDKEYKNKYKSVLITNGYYLTKDKAIQFAKWGLKYAQITVDGLEQYHDSKRMLKNGSETFQTIINNIIECVDIIPISVHINLCKENAGDLYKILNIFVEKQLTGKIEISIAPIIDPCILYCNELLSPKQFAEIEMQFYKLEEKLGFNLLTLPETKFGFCEAVSKNNYLIDPDGDLFMCWEDVGNKNKIVGSIFNGPDENNSLYKFFTKTIDFGSDKCKGCCVLPLCLSGCPKRILDFNENLCSAMKYCIEEWIVTYYNLKLK